MPKLASFPRQSRLRNTGLTWPTARETLAWLLNSRAILPFTNSGSPCGTLVLQMTGRRPTANNKIRQVDHGRGAAPRGVRSRGITIVIYLLLVGISLAVFGRT